MLLKSSRYYLPAVAWTLIMLVLTLLPASDLPRTFFFRVPYFDKLVHAGIFGLFVVLWYAGAYKKHRAAPGDKQYHPMTLLARVILAAILLGLLIEVVQKEWATLHRDFEWMDWLADILGAFFGGALANEIFRIRPRAGDS